MPHVDRDGVKVWYEDAGSGPALLLTHGIMATHRMWDPQVSALADRWRLIGWDLRGHGMSDSPDDQALYTREDTIGDMAAILDACDVDQAILVGSSLGGYLSLAFHLACSERVRALVLCDSGPGFRTDEARQKANQYGEKSAKIVEDRGLDALGKSVKKLGAVHHSAIGIIRASRGFAMQRDSVVIDSLSAIKVPTFLMAGANDTPFLAGLEYMYSKIPNARKALIDEAAHVPNLEQPEAFNRELISFLESLEEL